MSYVDIVFDGPPGHESGRFVEVEDDLRQSINLGEWHKRSDGYWVLRIQDQRPQVCDHPAEKVVKDILDGEFEMEQYHGSDQAVEWCSGCGAYRRIHNIHIQNSANVDEWTTPG